MADGEVAIRADDDPVRDADRPVQAGPQAGLPPPVPDARQDRRRRDRRSAVGQLHADSVRRPLRGPGCPSRRFEPPRRPQHLHDRSRRVGRSRRRLPEDDLHRRTERAAVRPGRELHAGTSTPATSLNNWVETRCDLVVGTPTPFNGTCVVGPPTQDAARLLHLHLHASAGQQPGDAGRVVRRPTSPARRPTGSRRPAPSPPARPTIPRRRRRPARSDRRSTDGSFVTTTCTKPVDTAGYAPGAACVANDGTDAALPEGHVRHARGRSPTTRCRAASCTAGTAGVIKTDLPDDRRGTERGARAPVQTCVNGSSTNAPDYYETTCTNPPATNQTKFTTPALCGTPGITVPTGRALDHDRLPQAGRSEQHHGLRRSALLHQRSGHRASVPEGRLARRSRRCRRSRCRRWPARLGTTYGGNPTTPSRSAQARLLAADPGRGVHADRPDDSALRRHHLRHGRAPTRRCAFCNVGDPTSGRHQHGHLRQAGRRRTTPDRPRSRPASRSRRRSAPNFVKVTCAGSDDDVSRGRSIRRSASAPVELEPAVRLGDPDHHLLQQRRRHLSDGSGGADLHPGARRRHADHDDSARSPSRPTTMRPPRLRPARWVLRPTTATRSRRPARCPT